jgi:phosphoglycerate dehydrogenase-like enzyme
LHRFLHGLHQLIKSLAEFVNAFILKLLRHFADADAQFQ